MHIIIECMNWASVSLECLLGHDGTIFFCGSASTLLFLAAVKLNTQTAKNIEKIVTARARTTEEQK